MQLPLPSELKLSRKRAGLTQAQLANLANVPQSVIAKIENAKVDPAYSTVLKLFSAIEKNTVDVKTVGEVMHRNVVTVTPSDLISNASRKMKKLGVSQLPVVLRGEIVGLLSEEDVLRVIEISGGSAKALVKKAMSAAPPVISSIAPASSLSAILHHSPIVCVVKGAKLVGVVTRADLLSAF